MTDLKDTSVPPKWTTLQAYTLAVVCLLLGIAGGWLLRGSQSPAAPAESAAAPAPSGMGAGMNAQPTPDQMKAMGDAQAKPLLEKLKSDPNNPDLLASIGNLYYDAKQYSIAVDYYGRSLQARPSDAAVRTDMATAYWYMGDADTAIAEFNKALVYAPDNPNTLFNLGLVKWRGKMDAAGAIADWNKLLETSPKYEQKAQVEQMLAEAKKHAGLAAK